MPYTIACADAGISCPATFTTDSRDELFEHIIIHEAKEHPEMTSSRDLTLQLERLVRSW